MQTEAMQLALANPSELYRISTDVAGVCGAIVKQTAVNIQGKKYVKAEGWLSIAAAHGCIASAKNVEHVEGGVRATGELRRMSDGAILATAEGFVGDDEPKWANGAEYARRAMAQTRAVSRVCRSAFAHVVVLIDSGLSTTPAEEVPDGGFGEQRHQEREQVAQVTNGNGHSRDRASSFSNLKRVMREPSAHGGDWRNVLCTYGKKDGPMRGKQLGELNDRNFEWLEGIFLKDGAEIDPKDAEMVDALRQRRSELNDAAHGMGDAARELATAGKAAPDDDEIPF